MRSVYSPCIPDYGYRLCNPSTADQVLLSRTLQVTIQRYTPQSGYTLAAGFPHGIYNSTADTIAHRHRTGFRGRAQAKRPDDRTTEDAENTKCHSQKDWKQRYGTIEWNRENPLHVRGKPFDNNGKVTIFASETYKSARL